MYDIRRSERELDERYPLGRADGVRRALRDYFELNELKYRTNDISVANLLIELADGIGRAELNERERTVLHYKYVECLADNELANILEATEEDVRALISQATKRIAQKIRTSV